MNAENLQHLPNLSWKPAFSYKRNTWINNVHIIMKFKFISQLQLFVVF